MKCPSCGGDYADWAHKCPYCGTVNEKVDEELYLKHLEEIRGRLDQVDEEAEETYRKEVGGSVKKILRIGLIFLFAALLVVGIVLLVQHKLESDDEKEAMKQKAWEKEEFAKLDAWYEDGDYGRIVDEETRLLLEKQEYGLYNWPHYEFIFTFYAPDQLIQDAEKDWEKTAKDDYLLGCAIQAAMELKESTREIRVKELVDAQRANGRYGLTEEEAKIVSGYRETAAHFTEEYLHWTEEETEAFFEECRDEYYIKLSTCLEKAKEMIEGGFGS